MMSLVKLKKGDSVNVYMFTGCFSATKVISEATKDTLTVTRNASYGTLTEMIFDKAGPSETQVAFEVSTQVTTSLFAGAYE